MKLEVTLSCISCDSCRQICPENAILTDGETYVVEQWACINCDLCKEACPTNAIKDVKPKK